MKKILAFILIILPLGSFASILTFYCRSTEVPGNHRFEAYGVVSIDGYNKVEGLVSLQIAKAQVPESVQVFEEISIQGLRQHFKERVYSSNSFDQLILTTDNSYIKSLNLLLNIGGENASQVFSVDNFMYRSNCIIDSTK